MASNPIRTRQDADALAAAAGRATDRAYDKYEALGDEVGKLVAEKQRQYGDSVGKSAEILYVLYPKGIEPYQYADVLLLVRILDKLSRISQRGQDGQDLGNESPFRDIAGYGLLGCAKDEDR